MRTLLFGICLLGLGAAGMAYYKLSGKERTEFNTSAAKKGQKVWHVTRTAVEAGMDEAKKPDLGK